MMHLTSVNYLKAYLNILLTFLVFSQLTTKLVPCFANKENAGFDLIVLILVTDYSCML